MQPPLSAQGVPPQSARRLRFARFMQQATCQFHEALRPGFGFDIAWHHGEAGPE